MLNHTQHRDHGSHAKQFGLHVKTRRESPQISEQEYDILKLMIYEYKYSSNTVRRLEGGEG